MELGKYNTLVYAKNTDFGIYLKDTMVSDEEVLLPKKWVPSDLEIGDPMEVFLYKDSKGRLLATTMKPKVTLGGIAWLKVTAVTKIGAFLDWGLEKELLLPFAEQTRRVKEGQEVLIALYQDKSSRLAATMKLYPYLSLRSPYTIGDEVTGTVYEDSDRFGIFVAVDDRYSALIPRREISGKELMPGERITARISRIHEDGKIDLDLRKKAYQQMDDDAQSLLSLLQDKGGVLPLSDHSDPEQIRELTGMSKNAFKRAIGRLYKERRIELADEQIVLKQ